MPHATSLAEQWTVRGVPGPVPPWPVKRKGWILRLYQHSLSLAFLLLFLGSLGWPRVLAMVVLSVFLRERGSPGSKPVDSPHHETGR